MYKVDICARGCCFFLSVCASSIHSLVLKRRSRSRRRRWLTKQQARIYCWLRLLRPLRQPRSLAGRAADIAGSDDDEGGSTEDLRGRLERKIASPAPRRNRTKRPKTRMTLWRMVTSRTDGDGSSFRARSSCLRRQASFVGRGFP